MIPPMGGVSRPESMFAISVAWSGSCSVVGRQQFGSEARRPLADAIGPVENIVGSRLGNRRQIKLQAAIILNVHRIEHFGKEIEWEVFKPGPPDHRGIG